MTDRDLANLLEVVVCPACHSPLVEGDEILICTHESCRLGFPIREQIPMLLVEEAESLETDNWRSGVGDAARSGPLPGDDEAGELTTGDGLEGESA